MGKIVSFLVGIVEERRRRIFCVPTNKRSVRSVFAFRGLFEAKARLDRPPLFLSNNDNMARLYIRDSIFEILSIQIIDRTTTVDARQVKRTTDNRQ